MPPPVGKPLPLGARLGDADIPAARAALDVARRNLRSRRSRAWQSWVKGNLKSKARSVYAWAKRISPISREETLHWNTDECPVGIGTRVERGITEWSSFWTSGANENWQTIHGPALKPFTMRHVKGILRRMSPKKRMAWIIGGQMNSCDSRMSFCGVWRGTLIGSKPQERGRTLYGKSWSHSILRMEPHTKDNSDPLGLCP